MRKAIATALVGLSLASAAPAQAGLDVSSELVMISDLGGGNFSFSQGGWFEGATVTGTFSGIDANFDGQLDSFDDEVSDFTMSFSGNSRMIAFSFDFSNLFGVVYDLDGGPLGDSCGLNCEGIGGANDFIVYLAGPGPLDVCGEGFECAVVASVVPEPSNWAMLIAGFGLTGAAMRRRRYRAV